MSLIWCSRTEREKAHHDTSSLRVGWRYGFQAWSRGVPADRLVVAVTLL